MRSQVLSSASFPARKRAGLGVPDPALRWRVDTQWARSANRRDGRNADRVPQRCVRACRPAQRGARPDIPRVGLRCPDCFGGRGRTIRGHDSTAFGRRPSPGLLRSLVPSGPAVPTQAERWLLGQQPKRPAREADGPSRKVEANGIGLPADVALDGIDPEFDLVADLGAPALTMKAGEGNGRRGPPCRFAAPPLAPSPSPSPGDVPDAGSRAGVIAGSPDRQDGSSERRHDRADLL